MPVWAWVILIVLAAVIAPFGIGLIVRRIWKALPPPATFAEGQRALFGMLAAGAGMFCGVAAVAMVSLLMWGGWSKDEEHTIVVIFGWALGGFIAGMSIVMIGLLVGGPVGRFKGGVTKGGLDFEASAVGEPPVPTTTIVEGAARGAAAGAVAAASPAPPTQTGPAPPPEE